MHWRRKWQPTPVFLPGESQGRGSLVGCHFLLQCLKVKSESEVAQSCPTPSDPIECSLPGSSVHRIFQAKVPEWGAIASSEETDRHQKYDKGGRDLCHLLAIFRTASNRAQSWRGSIMEASWDLHHHNQVKLLGIALERKCSRALQRNWRLPFPETPLPGNTLAWKLPWMEEPGGLQSMGSLGVGHDWATSLSLFTFMHWRRKWLKVPQLKVLTQPNKHVNIFLGEKKKKTSFSVKSSLIASRLDLQLCRPCVVCPSHTRADETS